MPRHHSAPEIIEGGVHTDARGTVSFVNDFEFTGVDRFYTIRSLKLGKVRGWVGHKRDHKWFTAITGEVFLSA